MKRIIALVALTLVACAQIEKENTNKTETGSQTPSATTSVLAAGLYVADTVVESPGHTGTGFYDKAKITNGIRGGGTGAGGMDIFSLDTPAGASTHVVLSWAGKKIKNGTGADFVVYENGFYISGNPLARFMDLVIVEVSNDNTNYCGFAPDYASSPETTYSSDPTKWLRFAGRAPVVYNIDSNNLTASQIFQDNDSNQEGDVGGGDLFDLDQLSDSNYYNTGCSTVLRDELKTNGFRYLKLTPANRRNNPDTGAVFVKDGVSNGPDLDGVVARYAE